MAARGEVVADGAGAYALSGRLAERAGRLARSRTGATAPYDGTWHVAVVTASGDDPATRRERRAALRAARLGELRDGVWLRPANLEVELPTVVAAGMLRLDAVRVADASSLAAQVFDLSGWARRAVALCHELDSMVLDGHHALASGFERDAEVLRHLQRDPLLPVELLGPDWPGDALRSRYEAFDADYRALLAAAHREVASQTPG